MTDNTAQARGSVTIWAAGLVVATGAGVATAHGLFQVATAAGVPGAVAWLYPLITDGLALVAYAATARLHECRSRRYAATIVILAAGLSGLAQAVYLAGALHTGHPAPVGLRFGVGAWPAIAAALTAHLLHLIGTDADTTSTTNDALTPTRQTQPVTDPSIGTDIQPDQARGVDEHGASTWTFNPSNPATYNPPSNPGVQARPTDQRPTTTGQPNWPGSVDATTARMDTSRASTSAGSARERARTAAKTHRDRHGALPTVTELAQITGTSRGTAGNALKDLRGDHRALHIVTTSPDKDTT
jgi:hypothetical protein